MNMKRSKLLVLTPCVAVATVLPICSCNQMSEAEKMAHAIFDPADQDPSKPVKPPKGDFVSSLETLNNDERKNELLYSLFWFTNTKSTSLFQEISLKDLYRTNKVGIQTRTTTSDMQIKDNKVLNTYVGYVSFVFNQDYNDDYKKDDYIMITYDFKNCEPDIID